MPDKKLLLNPTPPSIDLPDARDQVLTALTAVLAGSFFLILGAMAHAILICELVSAICGVFALYLLKKAGPAVSRLAKITRLLAWTQILISLGLIIFSLVRLYQFYQIPRENLELAERIKGFSWTD